MRRVAVSLLAATLLLPAAGALRPAAAQQTGVLGYYRFPALHGDTLVFAAEGDLWSVSASGGVARRLTTHLDEETDPAISPDGTTLAFTARYEGPAELYTMPLDGGVPTRWTYEEDSSIATSWTPDGELAYTTLRYATLPKPQMVVLDTETGARRRIPLAEASEGGFDDTGEAFFFVRPAFHNNVTKRYTGGTARKIWRFADGDAEATPLTADYEGESHHPMWWDGRVWFVTDRDGTMNLWSMDEDGGDLRQHTTHSGWDVRAPDLQDGRIVYQLGADLWMYDIAAGQAERIPVTLASDFEQLREKWVDDPADYLTSAHLHPRGESVVLTARGRVFVAPAGQGRLVRASRESRVRYRDVVFMPDGERLLALSDRTGELEFTYLPANGVGAPEPLTDNGEILRFRGHPSPDGRRIAFDDNNRDLWILDTDTGEQRRVSNDREGIGDMAWSPDGRWLAFAETAMNSFRQVWIHDTVEETTTAVTSDRVNSFSIAWDRDGEFLYFLSDRNLRSEVGSPWGPRAPEPYFAEPIEIYEVALREGLRSPFRPDDELHRDGDPGETRGAGSTGGAAGIAGPGGTVAAAAGTAGPERTAAHVVASSTEQEPAEETAAEQADQVGPPVTIDLEGLQRRVRRVPAPAGDYDDLQITGDALFWIDRGGDGSRLMALALDNDDPEPVEVADGVGSFELSMDGERMLLRRGDDLFVVDATPRPLQDLAESRVDLSGWSFSLDVREDWRQIFIDAWRLERDWFYDPGMHGVDWESTLERYLPLVERVTTRDELSDLIGRVVGELSALHTSVRGGDLREGQDDVDVATLGARLVRAPDAGGYRVEHVYRTDPDYPDERSPLADPYLDVEAGDVILAVNGVDTLSARDIGALLRDQAGKQVLLTLRDASEGADRDLIVVPGSSERNLRYSDWEYSRRLRVEEATEGRVGYVHLRAMGSGDITDWYRQFYPVYDRQGLIIDVRRNSGGNIDSFVLDSLLRRAWMYWKERVGRPTWNMQYAFRGHMVVLVDENTASDGEAFAEGFRRLGLGPVIGARTWGGEIWLSSTNRLSDGGLARAPMMGVYGEEGEWLIEQVGVIPDIEVINLPHATFSGDDAQLDAAITYLEDRIAEDPRPVPTPPPYPDRGFDYGTTQDPARGGSGGESAAGSTGSDGSGGTGPAKGAIDDPERPTDRRADSSRLTRIRIPPGMAGP